MIKILRIILIALFLGTVAILLPGSAHGQSSASIVGGWAYTPPGGNAVNAVITFLSDGTYFMAEADHPDPIGTHQRGMERGTYIWDSSTGGFASTTIEDTNGDWGLSDAGATAVTVIGDTLTFVTSEGPFALSRVTSAPNRLVGSWYSDSGNAVFTFLSEGVYFEAEKNHFDPVGTHQPGMERGIYAWNPSTGAFSFTTLEDSNGDWGLSDFGISNITVVGNRLLVSGIPVATRVPDSPVINTQPQSQVAIATSNVTFTVAATGNGLTYQWRKDGENLGGQNSATLTLNNVTRASSGAYSVVVTQSGGSSFPSRDATLRVIVPQRLQPPQRGGGGQFQLRFADPDGALASDLSRLEVHYTSNFIGTGTVWVTNSGGLTISNGKILFDDIFSVGAARRFYRVIEK